MERFLVGSALVVAGVLAVGSFFGPMSFHIDTDDGPQVVQGTPVATGAPQTYAAQELVVRGAVGVLTVTPEARSDIVVEIAQGSDKLPAIKAQMSGDKLILDGGLRRRVRECDSGAKSITVTGVGTVSGDALPRIVVRTPMFVKVAVGDGVFSTIGPSTQAHLSYTGCGDAQVGDVKGPLQIDSAGSGDVAAGAAQSAEVNLAGSGEVTLATVSQGLTASIAGSGSARAKSVTGPLSVSIAGSGDVDVGGGAISKADVSIAGSGDVTIGAPVIDLDASIMGSGDVQVASVSGKVDRSVMGSGGVSIGQTTAAPPAPTPPTPPTPPSATP